MCNNHGTAHWFWITLAGSGFVLFFMSIASLLLAWCFGDLEITTNCTWSVRLEAFVYIILVLVVGQLAFYLLHLPWSKTVHRILKVLAYIITVFLWGYYSPSG